MESIEKQLADFKAEQDKRFEEFKASLIKPQFEVGKWYRCKGWNLVLVFIKEFKVKGVIGFGLDGVGKWTDNWHNNSDSIECFIPATESEVKEALVREAEKRGFKEGVEYISPECKFNGKCYGEIRYEIVIDVLYYGSYAIYNKGKWATIVDSPIKIGGYEVKFHNLGTQLADTSIDGNVFTKKFWEAAKKISEHSKAKIMIGCSKQFDVSLTTINAILEKLK